MRTAIRSERPRSLRLAVAATALAVLALLVSAPPAARADTEGFSFSSWHTEIRTSIERGLVGGEMVRSEFVETIVADFPEQDQNRGIVRAIPVQMGHQTMRIEDISVVDENGEAVFFERSQEQGSPYVQLALGDDDYVHGETTYVVSYALVNTLREEEYSTWYSPNLVPENRGQRIDRFSAEVTIPAVLAEGVREIPEWADHEGLDGLDIACYLGASGSSDTSGCDVARTDTGEETTFSVGPMDIGTDALTLELRFDESPIRSGTALNALSPLQAASFLLLLVGLGASTWATVYRVRFRRTHAPAGPVPIRTSTTIPPVRAGILRSGGKRPDARSFAASVLSAAVHGALRIEPRGDRDIDLRGTGDLTGLDEEQRAFVLDVLRVGRGDAVVRLHPGARELARRWGEFAGDAHQSAKESGDLARRKRAQVVPAVALSVMLAGSVLTVLTWRHVSDDLLGWFALAILLGFAALIGGALFLTMPVLQPIGRAADDAEELRGLERFMLRGSRERQETLREEAGGDEEAALAANDALLPYAALSGIDEAWARALTDWHRQAGHETSWTPDTAVFAANLGTLHSSSLSVSSSGSSDSGGGGGVGGGGGSAGGGFGGGSVGGR
ncbi:DUF2207 family protein [Microbacterium sp. gxy059]|uniref:DUF2207 family protein n=1 Tax=Microbacterium sp. gxy059 TaxID=2957199 RepID=UPI003D95E6E4